VHRALGAGLAIVLALAGRPSDAAGQAPPPAAVAPTPPEPRLLTIERIDVRGLTRSSRDVALDRFPLRPGDGVTPERLARAVDALRATRIFRTVEVHTQPARERGSIVVVLEVEETRPSVRFGVGYSDLSGWYLIPAQLNLDNLTGHAERLDLSLRLGYRVSGLVLALRNRFSGSGLWEARARAEGLDHIYYLNGIEVSHRVRRAGLDLRLGHPLSDMARVEGWAAFETVEADSMAEVYRARDVAGVDQGDDVAFDELPRDIRSAIERRERARLGTALVVDSRRGSGLDTGGAWGALSGEWVRSGVERFGSFALDARAYVPLGGGIQAATRARAGAVTDEAPFHDRFYLGGLYTLRGFPSHSLSPPEGSRRFGTISAELRSVWVGDPRSPVVCALGFVDVGAASGTPDGLPDGVAVGGGYGFRVRVPWIDYVGLDVGFPLTVSPVGEAFHVNLSLGWAF
jgi:outer membrane protein insertion porin family